MEILQRRGANRTRYAFGEDALDYSLHDSSGSRSFSVAYTDISRDRQALEERNQWLRNAGLLWLVLGAVMTAINLTQGKYIPSIWLLVGAGCYAAYRFRSTHYTIVPSEKGNLFVIADGDGERILQQIQERRAAQFRREYDFMPDSEAPDQQRQRFKWLHKEGALSDEQLQQRLAMVDAADPARFENVEPPAGSRLN